MDMPHKIKMDYFVNGYSVITGGSCLDLPVAVAAGNLSKPAYQSYLAIRVAKENWDFSLCPWADDATQILSYLGFKFENLSINTWEELMFNLKKAVSKNLPLFIPVSYGNILYYVSTDDDDWGRMHIIMVTGYDEKRKLIFLVDANIVEHGLPMPNRDYTLYQIPMAYDSFYTMWSQSRNHFLVTENPIAGRGYIMSLSPNAEPDITDICKRILYDILMPSIKKSKSALCNYIDNIYNEKTYEESKLQAKFFIIRRLTVSELKVFLDLFDNYFYFKIQRDF